MTTREGGRELTGAVHDGESWGSAAIRTAGSLGDVPHPVDLSGETKASSFFAAPDHRNVASLRLLGFTRGLRFDEPACDGSSDTLIGCTLDEARVFG